MSILYKEPNITINGRTLTEAQAMTLRVALGAFVMDMQLSGLGNDSNGKELAKAYLSNAKEIASIMGSKL